MDNKSQYNNEDIRPPDSVKKDTLIDNEFNRHVKVLYSISLLI